MESMNMMYLVEEANSELLGMAVHELFAQEDAAEAVSGSSQGGGSARKMFNDSDDLILVRAVSVVKTWEAAYGTVKGIMKS
ncbi:hypothetical protein PR003_g3904 [Phytophthora rubi]|uniref:Uncharacterized protein n=1 Tax=Phytophthora rubi TaxID=129364 RepID=A0A6A4FUB3_9STRA|nr:hypothetical protein PR002_g3925 [Phytophthora rubi]KAE9048841.1 hypothetical protein PR001_g3657 [Phytophthora rubi]KAE9353352.1 hypothetical protein PR003_g3904 [Phytophthora rubi]